MFPLINAKRGKKWVHIFVISMDNLIFLCYNYMIMLGLGGNMEIIHLKPTGFSSNCYVIVSGSSAFVVDPAIDTKRIIEVLDKSSLTLCGILLTHGHFDHIWTAQELRDATGAPLYVHELDNEMLTDGNKNAFTTFTGDRFAIDGADVLLHEGDKIPLGEEFITVLHTPGHTKGSVCFDTGDSLIAGDTLFSEGFGRYDLYGGSLADLKSSLDRLSKLAKDENRWLYPGHGESSTLKRATEMLKSYF